MNRSEPVGASTGSSGPPISGIMATAKAARAQKENGPASPNGWLRKTWKARRIQPRPSLGSTRSSFIAPPASWRDRPMPRRMPRLGAALQQHPLEVGRVVRLQDLRVARQVHVPQAREPEAEGAGAHHRRQQADLAALERPHALV